MFLNNLSKRDMSTTDLIGYFSAFLTAFAFVPQAYLMEDKGFNKCFSADVQRRCTGLDNLWRIDCYLAHHYGKQCYFSAGMRGALPKIKTPLNFLVVPTHGCSPLYISVMKSVIRAGIAGIQATWTYLSLPSMALDTRFPAGMTSSYILVYNDERTVWECTKFSSDSTPGALLTYAPSFKMPKIIIVALISREKHL
jgi:hypothetical protein